MTAAELLNWARGPGLQISLVVFVLGITYRVLQNYFIGRKANLAEPRGSQWGPGFETVWRRSLFHPGMTGKGYFTLIAGYTFHIGFLVTLFLLAQHIELFRSVLGFGWPALPEGLIELLAVLSIAALVAVLIDRLVDPVRRQISDYQDYLTWALTVLPLVTGYMLTNGMLLPYTQMLAVHILSLEALLIAAPFTKLSHMVTIFIARWYNGAIAGYKGVQS
jgi:nitrate reductase gamma subunit